MWRLVGIIVLILLFAAYVAMPYIDILGYNPRGYETRDDPSEGAWPDR